jgi:hypothetical protein
VRTRGVLRGVFLLRPPRALPPGGPAGGRGTIPVLAIPAVVPIVPVVRPRAEPARLEAGIGRTGAAPTPCPPREKTVPFFSTLSQFFALLSIRAPHAHGGKRRRFCARLCCRSCHLCLASRVPGRGQTVLQMARRLVSLLCGHEGALAASRSRLPSDA